MEQKPFNPSPGAVVAGNHTLPDLSSTLHRLARGWSDLWQSDDIEYERGNVDRMTRKHLSALNEGDAARWIALCDAAGWTPYAAVAVSWCKGATLEQVWQCWTAAGVPILPDPASMRPARFLCPDLLPETRSIRELTQVASDGPLGMSALIVALEGRITLDLSKKTLGAAPPQVAAMLLAHQAVLTLPEDNQGLVATWKDTVAGTEFAAQPSPALH